MSEVVPSLSSSSPISKVPYDVLREIFIHCWADQFQFTWVNSRLSHLAPIVLCWVCSSWRMVALSSTILWSHFRYYMDICGDSGFRTSTDFDLKALQTDITFIQWWRRNQGLIRPYITVNSYLNEILDSLDNGPDALDKDSIDIVVDFLASSQYLYTSDYVSWKEAQQKHHLVMPYLHTLVINSEIGAEVVSQDKIQEILALIPDHSPRLLRRLCIANYVYLYASPIVPHHWSTLTHILFDHADTTSTAWFALRLAVPELQWGFFRFGEFMDYHTIRPPTRCTLPHLTSFHICCGGEYSRTGPKISRAFFPDFHFPALRTLSLSSKSASWKDSRAITDLKNILKFSPNITTLALGKHLLSLNSIEYDPATVSLETVAPVWDRTPHLTHLQFVLPKMSEVECFLRNLFRPDNRWLGLDNPACPIRRITFSPYYLTDIPQFLEIRKIPRNAPQIDFQIARESIEQEALEEWTKWTSAI